MATWGNGFGNALDILHLLTTTEILSGAHVLQSMTTLNLPEQGSSPGVYDPMLMYDDADSRWLIGYTLTEDTGFSGDPFYFALAHSTDLSSWTLIDYDDANNGYEGTKVLVTTEGIWFTVGGPAGSGNSSRVFDKSGAYQGSLDIVFSGGTDTQPHAMIFPHETYQYCLSFDDTRYNSGVFSWGDVRIYRADRY